MSVRIRSVGQRREAALAVSRAACATNVSGPPNEYAKEQPTQEAEPTALSALRGPIPDGNLPRLGAVGEIPRDPRSVEPGAQGPGSESDLRNEDLDGAVRALLADSSADPLLAHLIPWPDGEAP